MSILIQNQTIENLLNMVAKKYNLSTQDTLAFLISEGLASLEEYSWPRTIPSATRIQQCYQNLDDEKNLNWLELENG